MLCFTNYVSGFEIKATILISLAAKVFWRKNDLWLKHYLHKGLYFDFGN